MISRIEGRRRENKRDFANFCDPFEDGAAGVSYEFLGCLPSLGSSQRNGATEKRRVLARIRPPPNILCLLASSFLFVFFLSSFLPFLSFFRFFISLRLFLVFLLFFFFFRLLFILLPKNHEQGRKYLSRKRIEELPSCWCCFKADSVAGPWHVFYLGRIFLRRTRTRILSISLDLNVSRSTTRQPIYTPSRCVAVRSHSTVSLTFLIPW